MRPWSGGLLLGLLGCGLCLQPVRAQVPEAPSVAQQTLAEPRNRWTRQHAVLEEGVAQLRRSQEQARELWNGTLGSLRQQRAAVRDEGERRLIDARIDEAVANLNQLRTTQAQELADRRREIDELARSSRAELLRQVEALRVQLAEQLATVTQEREALLDRLAATRQSVVELEQQRAQRWNALVSQRQARLVQRQEALGTLMRRTADLQQPIDDLSRRMAATMYEDDRRRLAEQVAAQGKDLAQVREATETGLAQLDARVRADETSLAAELTNLTVRVAAQRESHAQLLAAEQRAERSASELERELSRIVPAQTARR